MSNSIRIAWTTISAEKEATALSEAILQSGLAACVQIDGPIRSFFEWQGRIESEKEFRICIKYPKFHDNLLRELVMSLHPYEEPQWISVEAEASAGYTKWIESVTR